MPAEGFQGHVAIDGSLLGTAGKWWACGWVVVQLDYDEEMEPLHGMYGSMEGRIRGSAHQEGGSDLRKGEKECIEPKAGGADLWIKNREELHELAKKEVC